MIVVSDSSPLIALARIDRLEILADAFGRILVPISVYHEITVAGRGRPGAAEVRRAEWIEPIQFTPRSDAETPVLSDSLGAGEKDAIILATSLPPT